MHRFYAQIFWPHGLKHKFFDPMDWSKPGFPIHQKLPKLAQTHIHPWWTWFGDAIQPPQPLPSPSPPAFNLSQHQALLQESVLHTRWPKYWTFSFSIRPSNEYSELISFRIDWFDILAVKRTLKNLLQHHSSKALILWRSAVLWFNSHIHTWLLEKP